MWSLVAFSCQDRSKGGKSRFSPTQHVRDTLVGRCILMRPASDEDLRLIGAAFAWDRKGQRPLGASDVKRIVFADFFTTSMEMLPQRTFHMH